MVPLDRALVSSYRLSIVTTNHVAVCSGLAAISNASVCGWVSMPVWEEGEGSAVVALDRALVNVYSRLIVIQFPAVWP